jgi:hypothetical protein
LNRTVKQVAHARLLGPASLIVAAVVTLPVAGSPLLPGGEFQYQAGMIEAFREHLQWGSQVIWTYGPYGYMNEPFFMDFTTWVVAFMANLAVHAAFFALLGLLLVRIHARPWQWLLAAVVVVLLFDRYPGQFWERFPVLDHEASLAAILLLYLATETANRLEAAVLAAGGGLAIGYLFLDKGTFLLAGVGLIVAYLALSLNRTRVASAIALMGGVTAGFLVLWMLDSQPVTGIPAYFRTTYEIIAGYPSAMSWFRESGAAHPTLQLGLGAAMLGATALGLLMTFWRRDWSIFRLLLLTSPVAFFAFKNAYARFDEGHALAFWALAGVLQGLVLVRALAASQSPAFAPVAIAAPVVLASVLLVSGLGPLIGAVPGIQPAFGFPDNLAGDRHAVALIALPDRRQAEEAQVNASLRAAYPLSPEVLDQLRQGSVDVLPVDLQVVAAYGLRWDPQPVLQMYAAYRPYLDHLDALHLEGPQAPRFVLLGSGTVDGRYPLFDGPETYRVLFQRYRILEQTSNLTVMERLPDAPLLPEVETARVSGQLGQWISVPSHGGLRLYGRFQVDYTLRGQALYLLNSPPELHIRFRFGGGQTSPLYRFVPALAADGLDLSAYAPDDPTIEHLAGGQFDQPIEAIQVVADAPVDAYQQRLTVAYSTQAVA